MILWREGRRDDVAAAVAMLADDVLGAGRETAALESYLAAFDAMQAEGNNRLIVGETGGETAGETGGEIVAVYQITFISGLSLGAARRAQIEGVRVSANVRGQGVGAALVADAEARAREAGCSLLQLTSNASRKDALRFYEAQGYTPSHIGFKKPLA
ncbi:MAG: GNAT family N-acetyltransferase [Maritimibacter sp.]|nr:GNAT family N-acetyltransferase [Maritimibacter sp.]